MMSVYGNGGYAQPGDTPKWPPASHHAHRKGPNGTSGTGSLPAKLLMVESR